MSVGYCTSSGNRVDAETNSGADLGVTGFSPNNGRSQPVRRITKLLATGPRAAASNEPLATSGWQEASSPKPEARSSKI